MLQEDKREFSDETLEHYETGEYRGVSEGPCNEIPEHYGMSRKHHGETKETLMRQGRTIMRQCNM